jgi:hypothetical protein
MLVLGAGTQRPDEVPIVGVRIRPPAETRHRDESLYADALDHHQMIAQ